MNPRIAAVVLGLAVASLGVALWREHAVATGLAAHNTRLSRQIADLKYEAKQAEKQADEYGKRAVELDSQLGTAKSRTTATESRQFQLTRELSETKNRLTEREQREVALMAELETLRQKVAAAPPAEAPVMLAPLLVIPVRAKPAVLEMKPVVAATPAPPPAEPASDVAAYQARITELEQQLTQLLTRALDEPAARSAGEPAPDPGPAAPYQVVRVGPQDTFVVVDYGAGDGARAGQILSLWRGTSLVARVQISDARPRFSLAQVLSATLKGQLQTGDLVLSTN